MVISFQYVVASWFRQNLVRSKVIFVLDVLFMVLTSTVFLLDESSAVNIYFTLGPAQIYNISDHCFVAILVGSIFF